MSRGGGAPRATPRAAARRAGARGARARRTARDVCVWWSKKLKIKLLIKNVTSKPRPLDDCSLASRLAVALATPLPFALAMARTRREAERRQRRLLVGLMLPLIGVAHGEPPQLVLPPPAMSAHSLHNAWKVHLLASDILLRNGADALCRWAATIGSAGKVLCKQSRVKLGR